jgi:hypothetical protein
MSSILEFTVDGKVYEHNDRPWQVCTNRHPETNGDPWGWIEGPKGNHTWSGSSGRNRACEVVRIHQEWLSACEHPRLKVAKVYPVMIKAEEDLVKLKADLVRQEGVVEKLRTEYAGYLAQL